MSLASALRAHQQNWNRMQNNTVTGVEQRAQEAAVQGQTDQRGLDLAAQKADMDDATMRRGQSLGLVGDLARPKSTGLEGLSSLLDGVGGSTDGSSVPPGIRFGSGASASTILGERGIGASGLAPGMVRAQNGEVIPGATTGYKPTGYKDGGLIDGPPPPPDGSDNVDIKAKAGEYVLPPEAVQLLGLETLDRIVTVATGQPPVHGGTPTDEGKPGFATGGGIEDLATQQRRAMQAATAAAPGAVPKFWNPGATPGKGLESVEPPVRIKEPVSAEALASGMSAPLPRLSAPDARPDAAASWAVRRGTRPPAPLVAGAEKAQQATKSPSQAEPRSQPAATAPSRATAPMSGANLPAHPDDDPMAMAHFSGPGDNVQATGITGKDSAGNVQQVYKNEFQPGSKEYAEYGAAIFSDSKRGATQRGFEADFAKTGNYAGDPVTGKGVNLPPTVGRGAKMGLGELSPQETQSVMMGYGPARQAGLQSLVDNANLETMRQWQGKDLSRAPQEVRDLYGQPAGLETLVERYMADTLSPEGQAQQRQQELGVAALKAAGRGRPQADSSAKIPGQMLDHFLKLNRDTDQGRANMALNTVMEYLPTMQQLGMSDAQMATVSTDLLNAIDGVTLSKEEAKGLTDQQQAQALALKQRTEYERQLRARLGLPIE